MGKLMKFIMVVISAVVLIWIIFGVINGVSNLNKQSKTEQQNAAVKVGKTEYDQVRVGEKTTGKGGMTLSEVEKILGQPTNQTVGQSGNKKMEVYTFASKAGPNSILVTFINGNASEKTQTGLE